MNEFFEKENGDNLPETINGVGEENSSIFSDPADHGDKDKVKKNRKLLKIGGAVLLSAVLVAGTLLIKTKIKSKNGSDGQNAEQIEILAFSQEDIKEVTVNNSNGDFKFLKKTVASSDSSSSDTYEWYVDGVDDSLTDSSAIGDIVSSSATMSASKEIKEMKASECGFEKPTYFVSVSLDDGRSYSLKVGSKTHADDGYFVQTSETGDKIYTVRKSMVSAFSFELLDLADASYFEAASFEGDLSSYRGSDGSIATFDSLSISGKQFGEEIKIVPNTDAKSSSAASFVVTSPVSGFADSVDKVLPLFSSTTVVAKAYSLDVKPETLKKFGLDDPDIVVSLVIAGQKKTFKIAKVDDEYCAVINDESKLIKKVSVNYLSVVNTKKEDYYNKLMAPYLLSSLSSLSVSDGKDNYTFDIAVSENDSGETEYTIKKDGKTIKGEYFQDFYYEFVDLSVVDYTSGNSEKEAYKITLKFTDNSPDVVYSLSKISATRYKCLKNGTELGNITASQVNKFIKALKAVSENKAVN